MSLPHERINTDRTAPTSRFFWRERRWWRRTRHASGAYWLGIGLLFASNVIAARGLGVDLFGEVILSLSIASSIGAFLDFTLEEAVVHYGSRAIAVANTRDLCRLLWSALYVDTVVGLAITLSIWLASAFLSEALSGGEVDPSLISLASLTVLGMTVNGTTSSILMLARRGEVLAWSIALTGVARVVLVAVAVRLGDGSAVLSGIVIATFVGAFFQGFFAWRVGWSKWAGTRPRPELRRWAPKLVTFGFHSALSTSITAVKVSLVQVIVGRLAGIREVGLLHVALFPITVVGVFSAPFRLMLLPEQARLAAIGEMRTLRNSLRLVSVIGLAIALPGAVAGWFLLPVIIPAIYSAGFDPAIEPARILLLPAVLFLAIGWSKYLAAAIGRPAIRTLILALDLITAIAVAVLTGHQGVMGAAWALSCSALVFAVGWLIVLEKLTKVETREEDEASSARAAQKGRQ